MALHFVGQQLQDRYSGPLPFKLGQLPLQPFEVCFAVARARLLLPLQPVNGKPQAVGGGLPPLRLGLHA